VWPQIADRIRRFATAIDLATIIFGLGLLLLLLFFFLPLIDHARLVTYRATLTSGEQRAVRQERDWKNQNDVDEGQRQRTREAWTKEKARLEGQIEEATINNARALSLYHYGLFAGSLLLAIASLAYLRPSQSTVRRVLGAIVLTAQIVIVLLTLLVEAVASRG
jgi:hypothetical protein